MIVPFAELQKAIYDRISGPLGADSPAVRVYSSPQRDDVDRPYVVLGQFSAVPLSFKGVDGADVTSTIHVWSNESSIKQPSAIMSRVVDLLEMSSLSLIGFSESFGLGRVVGVDLFQEEVSQGSVEQHGVLRYQWTIEGA